MHFDRTSSSSSKTTLRMFNDLPEEVIHLILWYYTNCYQGLLFLRCLCKDWKTAIETSDIWLFCDLTFYCPKEYLLLRRNDFKIINDSVMLRIFIESSNFVSSMTYHISLFQQISFQECLKVTCDKTILTFKKDERNRKLIANEICRWFIKLIGSYHDWWARCIYWRKLIGFCYHFLNANYIPILLPFLLFLTNALFILSIYYLNDLPRNLFQSPSKEYQILSLSENMKGFYCYYTIFGIYFLLIILKELWKYLYQLEYEQKLNQNQQTPMIPENLPLIISTTTKNCDDLIYGFFIALFLCIIYLHYQIISYPSSSSYEQYSSSSAVSPEVNSSDHQSTILSQMYWTLSFIPFWIWYFLSTFLLITRWEKLPWSLIPSLLFFAIFFTLFGFTGSLFFGYLDNLLPTTTTSTTTTTNDPHDSLTTSSTTSSSVSSSVWMKYCLFPYLFLDVFLIFSLISLMNYFQLLFKELHNYFLFYATFFFPSSSSSSPSSSFLSTISAWSQLIYYYFPYHLMKKMFFMGLVFSFLSVMIVASAMVSLRYFLPSLRLSSSSRESEDGEEDLLGLSSLGWMLVYLFGFHGLITTKLLEEIRSRFQVNE